MHGSGADVQHTGNPHVRSCCQDLAAHLHSAAFLLDQGWGAWLHTLELCAMGQLEPVWVRMQCFLQRPGQHALPGCEGLVCLLHVGYSGRHSRLAVRALGWALFVLNCHVAHGRGGGRSCQHSDDGMESGTARSPCSRRKGSDGVIGWLVWVASQLQHRHPFAHAVSVSFVNFAAYTGIDCFIASRRTVPWGWRPPGNQLNSTCAGQRRTCNIRGS